MPGIQKYFIALIPPEPAFTTIENIKKQISETYNTKASLRSPAHITLHMPFEWKEEKEDILIQNLNGFSFSNNFSIRLNNFSCFSPRVLFIDVIPSNELQHFQKELVRHIKSSLHIFNQAESERPFHPHLTIAFRDLRKNEFHKVWSTYKEERFSAVFEAESFWLLKHDGKKWNPYHQFNLNKN